MLTEQVKAEKKDNDKIKKVGPNVERLCLIYEFLYVHILTATNH